MINSLTQYLGMAILVIAGITIFITRKYQQKNAYKRSTLIEYLPSNEQQANQLGLNARIIGYRICRYTETKGKNAFQPQLILERLELSATGQLLIFVHQADFEKDQKFDGKILNDMCKTCRDLNWQLLPLPFHGTNSPGDFIFQGARVNKTPEITQKIVHKNDEAEFRTYNNYDLYYAIKNPHTLEEIQMKMGSCNNRNKKDVVILDDKTINHATKTLEAFARLQTLFKHNPSDPHKFPRFTTPTEYWNHFQHNQTENKN
jgi:hypothetical protein